MLFGLTLEDALAFVGQFHPLGAAVTLIGLATDKAFRFKAVDDAGHIAVRDHKLAGQVPHAQAIAASKIQHGHHVKAGQGGVKLIAQVSTYDVFNLPRYAQQLEP